MLHPKDNEKRRTGSRAEAIVHYQIDSNHWLFREKSGLDVGCDCELELSIDDEWQNKIIRAQIKGTSRKEKMLLKDGKTLSYPLEIKTVNYALSSSAPFLLILVDIVDEVCYFVELQELFITNNELWKRLEKRCEEQEVSIGDKRTLNIPIPVINVLTDCDSELQDIAFHLYTRNHNGHPKRVC